MGNYIEYIFINDGIPKRLDITAEEALKCQQKYKALSRKLEIENIFDVFVEEFKSFKSILSQAQLSQEYSNYSKAFAYIENQKVRTKLNVSYLSILNTGKLLLDRLYNDKSGFSIINDIDKSVMTDFKEKRESLFIKNQNYVLGCNLRNLCQHKLLPINRLTLESPQKLTEEKFVTTFILTLSVSSMKKDDRKSLLQNLVSDFKNKINKIDQIDLNRVIDGYYEGVFDLIKTFRLLVKGAVKNSEEYFEKLVGKTIDGNIALRPPALYIANQHKFYLDFEWFKVAHYLEEKNNIYFKSANLIRTQYIEAPST
jgi:hypothetical protein